MRLTGLATTLILAALLSAGCAATSVHTVSAGADTALQSPGDAPLPLPLGMSIKGVMIGVIEFSSYGVFRSATSTKALTEQEWTAAGLASLNLIGSSSLITIAGTGPEDDAWVRDPRWRASAIDFRRASMDAGIAVRNRNADDLLLAANRIASACQSCHDNFRPQLPKVDVTQFASTR